MTQRKSKPAIERLLPRVVEDENGCWNFTGARDRLGYGRIGLGGRGEGTALTHRVTYQHYKGEPPAGMDLDHLCRNPSCCNPDHLEAVPRIVNVNRGLHHKGWKPDRCRRGHEFTPENTIQAKTQRVCRECNNANARKKYHERKGINND